MKCNWQLQGPCLRNMSMSPSSLTAMLLVADSPELWLHAYEGHSTGYLPMSAFGQVGKKAKLLILAKSKAFPGILGSCPWLKDAQMKSHLCAIYSVHGSLQYNLLGTINS